MGRTPNSREKRPKKGSPKELGPNPKTALPAGGKGEPNAGLVRRLRARLTGWKSWLADFKEPLLAVPLAAGLLCVGWVLYNAHRPWLKVDALISSREVVVESETDDDGIRTDYYVAYLGYVYSVGPREFTSSFSDGQVGEKQGFCRRYEEAVIEAKRYQLGSSVPVYVDSRHPELSTRQLPGTFWPLLGVAAATFFLWLCVEAGPAVWLIGVALQLFGTWYLTRLASSEELSAAYQVRPYLEIVKAYPSLGYVPQNKIRKFDSFEELLKNWGRPDELWVDDVDQSRRLVLTYRHSPDWSEAWSQDFQIQEDGAPPLPFGPRKNHPQR